MWFHNGVFQDLIDNNYLVYGKLLYDGRVYMVRNVFVRYIPAMYFCCCCCRCGTGACRCCSSCAGWQNLLLWSIASYSSAFFSLHSNKVYFLCTFVPLGSTLASTCGVNTYRTYSVMTGTRGAKASVSSPRRSPPRIEFYFQVFF